MNSFTRIGLPVLLVVVAVFLITVVSRYSSEEDKSAPDGLNSNTATKLSKEPPLKFHTMLAAVPDPEKAPKHLRFWQPEAETNEAGYYNFWVSNKNPQPVTVRAIRANCQCASVELSNPKPSDVVEYTAMSALLNSPLIGAPMPVSEAVIQTILAGKLEWKLFYSKDKDLSAEVPPADANGTQLSIVRMNWAGRESQGARTVSTDLAMNLPATSEVSARLEAQLVVVPSFAFIGRAGDIWTPITDLQLGEIRENSKIRQEFYVASTSRLVLDLSATIDGDPTPCVTISPPVRASEEDVKSMLAWKVEGKPFISRVGSLYKITVDVNERAESETGELKQLDLGVIDRRIRVENGGEHRSLTIRGRTLGDIRVLNGAETGKIEMGNGFTVEHDIQKVITLIAERPGLDITLLTKEIVPNYLKVKLEPQKDIDGRKHWRLSVVIPKGTLYGSLPSSSVIILQTNDPTPRKIRLPVLGSSYDSGANKP